MDISGKALGISHCPRTSSRRMRSSATAACAARWPGHVRVAVSSRPWFRARVVVSAQLNSQFAGEGEALARVLGEQRQGLAPLLEDGFE